MKRCDCATALYACQCPEAKAQGPNGRDLPWHPLPYNEHLDNRLVAALMVPYTVYAVLDSTRRHGFDTARFPAPTASIPNIQETIRPGVLHPAILLRELMQMPLPIPPPLQITANTRFPWER